MPCILSLGRLRKRFDFTLVWYEENPEKKRNWRITYIYAYISTFFNRKISYICAVTGNSKLRLKACPLYIPFPCGSSSTCCPGNERLTAMIGGRGPQCWTFELHLTCGYSLFLVRIFTYYWLSWFYIWFIDIFSLFLIVLKIQRKYIYIYRLFGRYFPANIILLNELLVCVNLIFLHRDNVRGFISVKREREREKFNEFPLFYIYNSHMLLLRLGWFCW